MSSIIGSTCLCQVCQVDYPLDIKIFQLVVNIADSQISNGLYAISYDYR
jgi:hypothetical protein